MLIIDLWRRQTGSYFLMATKSATGKWTDKFFSREQLKDVRQFIADNMDKDIYFCPHSFSKPKKLKENAILPKLLWADLDAADPRKIAIKPTVAIESSPGRFVGLWVLDKPMDEELNRALSHSVGADRGGWDLTQVLRVPGTHNYKYANTPKVRTLWDDGPSYLKSTIAAKLPKSARAEKPAGDAHEIFAKYERKMPAWCRRELLTTKAPVGKRSEMIWKLEHALIDIGCSKDESFVLIKASAWNKFKGRRNEDEQLRSELDKIVQQRLASSSTQTLSNTVDYQFLARSLEDVEEEDIDWIWYPYFARGELTIVEGDPGVGKSYATQMCCLSITDGKPLPMVKKGEKPVKGKVAYFDIENSAGSVTKRRMVDNGMVNLSAFVQEEIPFSIDDEEVVANVEEALERLRPAVVVFDTINTYIGKADTHKGSDTQQAMGWFRLLAKRFNCAAVVLRHLTKGSKEKALYRGQGSIAFSGMARVVITVGVHPEDPDDRVWAVTKLNVAKTPRALTFSISGLPDTLKHKDRSIFKWGDFVDYTSDDILSAPPGKKESTADVEEFLKNVLDAGPLEAHKIEVMAEKRGFSKRAISKAAEALGIRKYAKGFGKNKVSWWDLD